MSSKSYSPDIDERKEKNNMFKCTFVVERNYDNMCAIYEWYQNIEPFHSDGIYIRINPETISIQLEYEFGIPRITIDNFDCMTLTNKDILSDYSEIPVHSCVWITLPADKAVYLKMDFRKLKTELISYGGWYA